MMNGELQSVVEYLQRDRGVDRETIIQAIESALINAARKDQVMDENTRIGIDRKNLRIRAYVRKEVVMPPALDPKTQVDLKTARRIDPGVQVGEIIEVEEEPVALGRIAAQTAKQTIVQRLRQAEKEKLYSEYKDSEGDIVTGTVIRFEKSDVIVELEHGEARIPSAQRISTEDYEKGERIRAYVMAVNDRASGPEIVLSRNHPDFVRRLFELEVSEIADGTVEIMGIAREAGFRSKVAVLCHDPHVDPVGACVGVRGMRVKNIVRELGGEKVDIVPWSDDIRTYVTNSLAPARLKSIQVDDDTRTVTVMVDPDQLSLAIGKRGQNARLTAKLTGWRIDIQKIENAEEVDFEKKIAEAVERLAAIEGVGYDNAEKLVYAGFLSPEGVLAAEIGDIAEVEGFTQEEAEIIWKAVEAAYEKTHGTIES